MTIEKLIQKQGWTLEQSRTPCEPLLFWAAQGGFTTPKRPEPQQVLEDVQDLRRTEVAAALIETNPKAAMAEFRNE